MLHVEPSGPGGCARASPAVVAHLSLLFVLYGGALLATAARFKWDPSTYIPVRLLLPAEYPVLCALLPLAGLALVALAHLAVATLARPAHKRRTLYLIFAVCTGVSVVAEVAFSAWAAARVNAWLETDVAHQLRETIEVREHVLSLLAALEKWHPLPNQIRELLQEAEADLPWNGYVACAAAAVLLAAQLAALVFALVAGHAAPARALAQAPTYKRTNSRNSAGRVDRALLEPGFR